MTLYQQYTASQKAVEKAPVAMLLTGNLVKVVVGDFMGGSPLVREVYTLPIEDGSLVDGRIVDEDAFSSAVSAFLATRHLTENGIRLVIDSADFVCRVLTLPQRSVRIKEYIHRYFGLAERLTRPIYTYLPLTGQSGDRREKQVLVSAVSADTVDQLERVFRKMNLRLVSLEAALLSSVRILSELREIRGKTCLVQITDGRESTGLMFVKGVYRASMRSHLWEPFGTIGFGVEFARLNGQMLQNMQKEFPDDPPVCMYLGGLREDNLAVVSEAIQHLGTALPLGTPDGSAYVYADHQTAESPSRFSEYLAPIAALRYPDEARDFLSVRRSGTVKRMPMRYRVITIAASLVFLILGATITYEMMTLNALKEERAALQGEVVVLKEKADAYEKALGRISLYSSRTKAMEQLSAAVASYPYPNSALNAIIRGCTSFKDEEGNEIKVADVKIESYDAAAGKLQFTVRAPADQVQHYYRFPEELRKIGVFDKVSYEGFVQDGEDFRILVDCILSFDAGKPSDGRE